MDPTEAEILGKYTNEPAADDEQAVLAKYAPTDAAPTTGEDAILSKYAPDAEKPAPTDQPAEPDHKADILGAFKLGLQKSTLPFSVSTEDLKSEDHMTSGEKIAETVANVGSDLVTSIGTGAAVGSLVPGAGTLGGAAVGLGLGIYRALGYEDMHTRKTGEEFNVGRAALNVAAEVNPVLRLGGPMTKFVTQGALGALQSLSYGGEGSEVAVSALLGGALSALGHHKLEPGELQASGLAALIVPKSAGPAAMGDMAAILTENGTRRTFLQSAVDSLEHAEPTAVERLMAKPGFFGDLAAGKNIAEVAGTLTPQELNASGVGGKLISEIKNNLRQTVKADDAELTRMAKEVAVMARLEDGAEDVARMLTRDYKTKGPALFEAADQALRSMSMTGEQAVELTRFQKALDAATEAGVEELKQWGRVPRDPLDNTLLRSVSDQKFAARMSDRATGLDLEPKFAQISVAKNNKNQFVFQFAKRGNEITKEAKKVGISRSQLTDLLGTAPESWPALSDEAKTVVGKARALFEEGRSQARAAGIDIGWLDNYVTAVAKDPADYVTAVRREARKFIRDDGSVDGRIFKNDGLLSVLANARGKQITEPKDVIAALNALDNPMVLKGRVGFEANAAFQREGVLPDFLREKDFGKIIMVYGNNLGNAMFMDPAIRQLEVRIPALQTLGHTNTADWLETQIKRLSGQKSGFQQALSNGEVRWKAGIDEMLDVKNLAKWQVAGLKTARFAPDLVSWGISQIYPNMLGFNPKAVIRNLSQVQLVSAGDVGGIYGQKLGVKSMLATLRDKTKGVDLQKTLEEMGYHPGEHIGEGMNSLHNALESTLAGPIVRASDAVGKIGMKIYGQTDALNRYATMKMSEMITADLTAGIAAGAKATADQQAAIKFLRRLPPGYKNEIYADIKAGKSPMKGITEYLISSTQFDYGPHAMSEFGQTFGRFATMFTKWPAMVFGDVHDLATSHQVTKAMTKYLAPLAALGGLDMLLKDTKDSPRMRALGLSNFADWSPAMSLKVSAPPVLQIAGGIGKSFADVVTADFAGAGREALKAIDPILPFNSLRLGVRDKLFYNTWRNEDAPHLIRDELRNK